MAKRCEKKVNMKGGVDLHTPINSGVSFSGKVDLDISKKHGVLNLKKGKRVDMYKF